MKYIYQDSKELPVQRDFIEDLKTFLGVTSQVIPLENSIIEIKCKRKEALHELKSRIEGMNNFEERLETLLKRLVNEADIEDVIPCANAVLQTCNENLRKRKEVLGAECAKIENGAPYEYKKIEAKILEVLSRFLISGVYGTEKRFELSSTASGVSGEMESWVSGLQYHYSLGFTEESLTVEKLLGNLSLPAWTRAGILRKEEKIKMQDLSEFLITFLEYDTQRNVRITFENRKANRKFRIEGGDHRYFVYEDNKEITADKELGAFIDIEALARIPEKIQIYLRTNIRTYTLSKVLLDEEDAVSTNQIFDCLKVIAEQYGVIVQECLAKGHNKEEITIKIEEADGTRTEKYIAKAEIYTQLAEVGSEGIEIAGILGVDSRTQIRDRKYLIV
ncbi:chromosome segregation ATPase [Methanosarcina sp. MSH10X1]|uniref:chromosome segregation ATPase n=1 Tax=Methanosarcina sp. MSH10X1 TaxID=2507075 RepID=UPI000FFBBDEB|nr:chromosome segregation ATPase [Methanosarcina sp. MSH10X1]RXA20415.1 chromosome segregation ATPase [Methanosarcina sp. MSH10X1]